MSIRNDPRDFECVGDVIQRVRLEQNKIGHPARVYRAKIIQFVLEFRWIRGSGLQGFERRKACRDEAFEFKVKTDAGNHVNARGGIGARQKRHIRRMQLADDLELVIDKFFANGKRIGIER